MHLDWLAVTHISIKPLYMEMGQVAHMYIAGCYLNSMGMWRPVALLGLALTDPERWLVHLYYKLRYLKKQ